MVIDVRNLQGRIGLDEKEIRRCAASVLRAMNEGGSELSILLVSDSCIRDLNVKYRKKDSSTDVLAFPMRSGQGVSKKSPVLGDVAVSVETAKREAIKRKIPFQKELCLYIIHGILHLLGYDDRDPSDRKKMRAREETLLESL